jgi:transcriptional regulator with XRE-family HTH domain
MPPMPDLRTIRQRLREQSPATWSRYSRTAVAARLGVADITIGRWERGHQRPHPRHVMALAEEYEVSVEQIEEALNG